MNPAHISHIHQKMRSNTLPTKNDTAFKTNENRKGCFRFFKTARNIQPSVRTINTSITGRRNRITEYGNNVPASKRLRFRKGFVMQFTITTCTISLFSLIPHRTDANTSKRSVTRRGLKIWRTNIPIILISPLTYSCFRYRSAIQSETPGTQHKAPT